MNNGKKQQEVCGPEVIGAPFVPRESQKCETVAAKRARNQPEMYQ